MFSDYLQSPTDPTKFRIKKTQTKPSLVSQHYKSTLGSEINFTLLTYHHNKGIFFRKKSKNNRLSANRLTIKRTHNHYAAYRLENTKQKTDNGSRKSSFFANLK